MKLLWPILVFALLTQPVKAQQKDSLLRIKDSVSARKEANKKIYSIPRKASILSAVLPGAGQVYNKKYWKVPLIYAGLGGFGYMFYNNNNEYRYFRQNVIAAYDNNPETTYDTRYTPEQLQSEKKVYKRYRDLAFFGFSIIYILNIIDANVDGHLRTFDVSDDLSLQVSPWQNFYSDGMRSGSVAGFSLKLNFR